jgi:inosine/xanthosine triphosphate pyrophosphatase family protein
MQLLAGALFHAISRENLPVVYFECAGSSPNMATGTSTLRICEFSTESVTYEAVRESTEIFAPSPHMHVPSNTLDEIMGLLPELKCREVYLSTGSPVKRGQYSFLFRAAGITTKKSTIGASPPEPQVDGQGHLDEQILVRDPLKRLARFAAKSGSYPLILEDTMLFIEHFNSDFHSSPILPGPDTKRWWNALGSSGLLELMGGSTRRSATFVCQMGVLTKGGGYSVFRSERRGRISLTERPQGPGGDFFPYVIPHNFHSIFIPEGSAKTYAEMLPGEFRSFDYRADCVGQVTRYLHGASSVRVDSQPELF